MALSKKVITKKSKWLILNSPSNPTGSCYSMSELEEIANMSSGEATNEYYKQLKELFGLSDEDKARDLSLTMAQFGFAMAAGQSPNALTNIANAATNTLNMMKEDRATEREREDRIKMFAFTESLAESFGCRNYASICTSDYSVFPSELNDIKSSNSINKDPGSPSTSFE